MTPVKLCNKILPKKCFKTSILLEFYAKKCFAQASISIELFMKFNDQVSKKLKMY